MSAATHINVKLVYGDRPLDAPDSRSRVVHGEHRQQPRGTRDAARAAGGEDVTSDLFLAGSARIEGTSITFTTFRRQFPDTPSATKI